MEITLYDVEGNRYEADADEIVGYGDNGMNMGGQGELFLCTDCYEASLDDVQRDFPRPVPISEFYTGRYECHLCDQLLV